ncbi:hypothetical protein SLS62_000143 [Diatrype stigma]|uniref:SnoaL-like domain-containing protein n=1 Tax=Diatrype stigma TaxID=117547 RepID=A0AAN9V424_9PEZI
MAPETQPIVDSSTASELLAPFMKAWTASDPDALIACYADSLEYSDYATNELKIDKSAKVQFIKGVFEAYSLVDYQTVSKHGTRALCTLECLFTLLAKEDSPFSKKGDILKLPGASLFKFDQDGKITMQHDYYCLPMKQ